MARASEHPIPPYQGPALSTEQPSASEIAERYLTSLIFSGQLGPGDKLPSERELAAHFGIARITLRAALRSLENRGFLVIKIGSKGGAWINEVGVIQTRWEEWMRTHKDQIREILDFRRVVETEIAALAAQRRTAKDLKLLDAIQGHGARPMVSPVHPYFGFHDALAKAAHNRYLEEAMLITRSELFLPAGWGLADRRRDNVAGVHDRILEAVRDKDPVRAVAEMATHIELSAQPFRAALRRR